MNGLFRIAAATVFVFCCVVGTVTFAAEGLRAGAATSNITPPIGDEIIGGFVPTPSTHVNDELHARCLVLDEGETKLALVVCDLLGIHRQVSEEARKRFIVRRIADGVTRAVSNLRPAEIAFGTAEAPEHVFNRRWSMRPGTIPENPFGGSDLVKMNPPAGSPNLLEPAGPTDPTISLIAVREPMGAPISVFAAYSLHYVGGVGFRT